MAMNVADLAIKLSGSPAGLVAALSTGEKRLNQFGSAVDKKMADVQKSFSKPLGNVKMPGLDAIKNKIDGINASAEKMGKGAGGKGGIGGIGSLGAVGGVAAGMGMSGFLTPMAGVGIAMAGAVKVGTDFDRMMSRVKALTGATGEEFDALRDLALKLGRETEFSASQAAEGMSSFALSGFKAKAIMDVMTPSVRLASAGMIDIGKSAEISAIILRAMGMEENKLGKVTDVLTFAMTNALTDMTQLSDAFKYVAPTAKMAGLSIEETTAAIMMLSDQGIQGSEAGTVLRNMLKKSSDQSDEARQMMEMLNITFHDAKGNFRGFGVILDDLNRKFAEMNLGDMQKLEILGTMFEIRAGTGFAALLDKGGKYNDLVQRIAKEHVGLATKISGIQIDNLWGDLKIFWSSVQDAGIKFFDAVKGPLRAFVQGFNDVVLFIGRSFVGIGDLFQPLIAGAASFGRGIMSVVEGPMGLLLKITGEVGSTFLSFVDKGLQGLGFMLDKLGKGLSFLGGKIKETFSASDNGLFSKIDMEALQRGEGLKVKSGLVFDTDPASLDRAMENVRRMFQGKPILLDAEIGIENSKRVGDVGLSLLKPQDNKRGFFDDLMGGIEKFSPGNLLKMPVAETVERNVKKMMDLQALIKDTDNTLRKQLASTKESTETTTQLTDGATLLEKAWQGVTTTTKDFAGILDQMKRLGATEEQLKPIKAMQEQVRQAMLSEKLLGEKARLFQDTRTPLEAFKAQFDDLQGLFDKGTINADLYNRSLIKLAEGFTGAGDAAAKMREATMFAGAAALKGSAEAITISQRARFEDRSNDKGGVLGAALEKIRALNEKANVINQAELVEAREFRKKLEKIIGGDKVGK